MKKLTLSTLAILALLLPVLILGPSSIADGGANHQVRNLHFGVSGGNVGDISRRFCCSGTLGSLVQDASGTQYILSNNHVLGLAGAATAGQDISQPGLIDNGCQVATVVADFTAAPALSSGVDCAVAALRSGGMDSTGFIEDIGTISSGISAPSVGLAVKKSGRTTGFTTGSISSINASVRVQYPTQCGGHKGPTFTFTNQVVISSTTFSAGGDSGSLIVTNTSCPHPVALLFAGSSSSTIGNPIGQVLSSLGTSLSTTVSFVGACVTLAPDEAIRSAPSEASTIFATQAMRSREESLLSTSGVIGVGVGSLDSDSSEAVIVVYVDQTKGVTRRLPKRISGVRVRTIYTEPFVAY